MISKNKIKYIHSLSLKKNRDNEKLFIAEGPKVVGDLLHSYQAKAIVATQEWLNSNALDESIEIISVSEDELGRISFMQHPQQVLAIFKMPSTMFDIKINDDELALALDGVQDPGNLGTIIRVADWYGISNIYCSKDTADVFNPKVVQATMGSIGRVSVKYVSLVDLLKSLPKSFPVYGTVLDGTNIYNQELTHNGLIVMGNEGKGISKELLSGINHKLFIPDFHPKGEKTADSLNVAIATAIVCSEFRRR